MSRSLFFHVDMDAFYATIEQARNPEYRGKPIMVGGSSRRGVVTTCSYEARAFGVTSGMPAFQAKKLCPEGIFLPIDMDFYKKTSKRIMTLLAEFTPQLHQVSIDEAFLDMTGSQRYIGSPEDLAIKIQQNIEDNTGATLSIGIASSKYVAKIASNMRKPRGVFTVPQGEEASFMKERSLKEVWGLGKKGREILQNSRITTVDQVLDCSEKQLQHILGERMGLFLYQAVRGIDPGAFQETKKSHTISNETTFQEDITSREVLEKTLLQLSQKVIFRTMEEQVCGISAGIKVVYKDLSSWSSRRVGTHRASSAQALFQEVKNLLYEKWDTYTPIRLIGVSVDVEKSSKETQLELFPDEEEEKRRTLEEAIFKLNKGGAAITRAKLLTPKEDNS